VLAGVPDLRAVVIVGGEAGAAEAGVPVAVRAWAELEAASPAAPADVGPEEPVAVMYTSGTTGRAKGVVCPHGYFSCWADDTGRAVGFETDDVLYSPLPLFHLTGQCVNVQLALVHGGWFPAVVVSRARRTVVVDYRLGPGRLDARRQRVGVERVLPLDPDA
jgi:acyl-coenzyme A synthetase/AMP-(fatty) acid ligase